MSKKEEKLTSTTMLEIFGDSVMFVLNRTSDGVYRSYYRSSIIKILTEFTYKNDNLIHLF